MKGFLAGNSGVSALAILLLESLFVELMTDTQALVGVVGLTTPSEPLCLERLE